MRKHSILGASCALIALSLSARAEAQAGPVSAPDRDATGSQQDAAGNGKLEEIVVTAQRRAENLQDVPISATALSAEGLNEKAVTRLSDLQFASPSLSFSDNGLVQFANIRGIGLVSSQPSAANGVATYVDGLFQPPIVGFGTFYDIASVEVLRGPQGTLVGSNSTGGAILINSQNPTFGRFGGYAEGGYGNYNAVTTQGALNVPITGNLAVRGAGEYNRHDTYYTDIGPFHNKAGRLDEKAGRGSLLWKPGDFQLLVKSELYSRDTGGLAMRPGEDTAFAAGRTSRPFLLDYDQPTRDHEYANINSAELKYTTSGGVTVRSLTGYQNKHVNLLTDDDATEIVPGTNTTQNVRERQLSEEINILSPNTGRFTWILGGYYQRNHINVSVFQKGFAVVDVLSTTTKVTTGIFARGVYALTENLQVELGGRYSHFTSDADGRVLVTIPALGLALPPQSLLGKHSDGRPTGKLALNWKVSPDNLLYAFVARGYKPGGYDNSQGFGPETVWNYEVGWKSNLADDHVRTQLDAFYNDYHGFQFSTTAVTPGQANLTNVTNLPTATIAGIEAQLQTKFGGFQADFGGAYIHSKLPGFKTLNGVILPANASNLPQCGAGLAPPACFDFTPYFRTAGDGPNLLSPKLTYNLGAQYSFKTGDGSTLTPRLNYAYVGPQWSGLFYSPILDRLKSRGLLSALLTLQMKSWRIEAYGQNLTNKTYVSGRSGNGANEFYGPPRQYGVRANVNF